MPRRMLLLTWGELTQRTAPATTPRLGQCRVDQPPTCGSVVAVFEEESGR